MRSNVNIDLSQHELQNAVLQVLGANPATPVVGQGFYHSGQQRPLYYSGSVWKLDASHLAGNDAAHYLARTNHTGQQTAATISDFDNQVRTSRLDQMAAPTAAVAFNGQRLTNVGAPVDPTDGINKAYADSLFTGQQWKASVRAAADADVVLSGAQTIDGVNLVAGDRVLLKGQTDASENGIWVVAAGAWTRSTDADADAEVTGGMVVPVTEGNVNADKAFILTTDDPIDVGVTPLAFTQLPGSSLSYAGGNGLTLDGTTFNVGAGTGISVGADSVAIDTAVVSRKYAESIGDGVSLSFLVNHNLGTYDVLVECFTNGAPRETVIVDVERPDVNNVEVTVMGVPPTADEYRVVVHG